MKALLVTLMALVVSMSSCSSSQEDLETLEATDGIENQAMGEGTQDNLLGNYGSLEQGGDEFGQSGDNTGGDGLADAGNNSMGDGIPGISEDIGGGFSSDGSGVLYVINDQTNAYAQADSASEVVRTLPQGEALLVTIEGDFAQSAMGYVSVSDLSAEMQPRSFVGNDWQ